MPDKSFADALNEQIGNEFAASQQYVAAAVYYDTQTLPQLAGFFYRQAVEERNHAMMMVQYLLDSDADVKIPGVSVPTTEFSDVVAPIGIALAQEKKVSDQIGRLASIAREEGDWASENFMSWFIKEQVEEVASMSSLLDVAERCRDDLMELEQYLAREAAGEGEDPSAPRA